MSFSVVYFHRVDRTLKGGIDDFALQELDRTFFDHSATFTNY